MYPLRRFFQHFGQAVRDHAHHKRVTRLLALALVCLPVAASAATSGNTSITDQTFSLPTGDVLHYMAPNGNDNCNGTSPAIGSSGNCAWATPNHGMHCGDVIVAAAGNYIKNQFGRNWGAVTNCPSTSGGIDRGGGIYFAIVLCGGLDLQACQINAGGSGNPRTQVEFYGGQSNWALEGFRLNGGGPTRGLGIRTCSDNGAPYYKSHHIALINSIVTNSMQGFGGNDCGHGVASDGSSQTTTNFMDYVAAVGNIVEDANHNGDYQGGICVGAIDFTNLGNWDTTEGPHTFLYNNYGINNQSPACASQYDGHAFYSDAPDAHGFSQLEVIANNIAYLSTRSCIALTYGAQTTAAASFHVFNNTCYDNVANMGSNTNFGELNLNTGNNNTNWAVVVSNNIAYTDRTTSGTASGQVYAWDLWQILSYPPSVFGVTGQENIFKGVATSCNFGNCDSTFSVEFNDQTVPSGANFYVNPQFTNTSDLLSNHTTVPNCTGFVNTTACMGWNAITQTLTNLSVISDLMANCTRCAGKGFQKPSTTCVSSGPFHDDFPMWLKGIVYLHYNSGDGLITQKGDLVTKPCGL
jgi:hypothetical protein